MANVVVEATGAVIDSSQADAAGGVTTGVVGSGTLPLAGYLAEPAATNVCLASETLDNATYWTPSSTVVTADQYVAPNGTTTMDKLACSAGAGSVAHYISQPITFTATIYTRQLRLRYISHRWVTIWMWDGTTIRGVSFDLLNGVKGAESGATGTIAPTAQANVYAVTITTSAAFLEAAGNIVITMNNTDTVTLEAWDAGAGGQSVGVTWDQVETGSVATSYIPTLTMAVERPEDFDYYATLGNMSGTTGTVYCEFIRKFAASTGNNPRLVDASEGATVSIPLYMASTSGAISSYDGAARTGPTPTLPTTSTQRIAVSYSGSTLLWSLNGAAAVSGTFDGNFNLQTYLGIGSSVAIPNNALNGHIKGVKIYNVALTAAQLQNLTGA